MKKQYLHKLETWHHPISKDRATVSPGPVVHVDVFHKGARYSWAGRERPTVDAARAWCITMGFKHPTLNP